MLERKCQIDMVYFTEERVGIISLSLNMKNKYEEATTNVFIILPKDVNM